MTNISEKTVYFIKEVEEDKIALAKRVDRNGKLYPQRAILDRRGEIQKRFLKQAVVGLK